MSDKEAAAATLESSSEATAATPQASATMLRTAFVLGYTGESGKALVKELIKCDAISKLVLIGRREVTLEENAPKIEQKVIDFEKLDEYKSAFENCDVGYSCIGTTRQRSGKAQFMKVDYDYTLNTARLAKEAGCQHFHLVSSVGAHKDSWFLYPQVKGQVEGLISEMGFPRCSIYRPAILLCDRTESRFGEKFVHALVKPIASVWPTWLTCPTTVLAQAMVNNTVRDTGAKVDLFTNKDIFSAADLSYYKDKK